MNELGDDPGRFDIDQVQNAEGFSDDGGFICENDRVGVWNGNHGTVGIDLHDALHNGDGLFRRNEGQRLVKAQHLVAIGRQGLNLAQERKALGARCAARTEDFDRLVIHRNNAVIVHQQGAFDDPDGVFAADRFGDHDREFLTGEVRVADDALACERFVKGNDIQHRVARKCDADRLGRLGGRRWGQRGSDRRTRRQHLRHLCHERHGTKKQSGNDRKEVAFH